jgi:serine protease Do
MKNFTSFATLFVVAFLVTSHPLVAQDAPPVPKTDVQESLNQESGKTQDSSESKSKSAQDKSASDSQEPSQQEADEKSGQKKSKQNSSDDKKADDKKADDKKAEDKKAEDKKAEDKKADDKKAEDKKADDKKADEKQADDNSGRRKSSLTLPANPFSRDRERIASYSKKSDAFVGVFESVVASADASTLQIVSGRRQIALGTVIDSNGYVLTKASELRGDIGCKLLDGTIAKAEVVGVDPDTDLALLKVDAENLNVIQWSLDPTPQTGQWVASPKADKELPTIGVVSVNAREIPASKAFIGITMGDVSDGDGVRISSILPDSPAELSKLSINDIILKIDDTEIKDMSTLREVLQNYEIADRITLLVKRGDKELKIKLTLAKRDEVSPLNSRSNQQNSMGSILSRRRKDFPSSFQHDSMLNSKTCGGPIVDLSGKVVGINIARAGRVSSLALTAATVRPVIERLKSGKLAPAVVNKAKIEAIDAELSEIVVTLGKLPETRTDLEKKYNVEKARMEELEKTMKDLKDRIKVIEEKATEYKSELDSVSKELRSIEKLRDRLEADRKQLATGSR